VGQLDQPACSDGGVPTHPFDLNLASPADYVGLYETDGLQGPVEAGAAPVIRMLQERGTPCSGATDEAACLAALEAATIGLSLEQSCGGPPYACQHFVLTTSGDTARLWTPDDYPELLGTIDTAEEARLLTNDLTFTGRWVAACSSVRATASGYDVVGTRMTQDCAPIVSMREHVHVDPDGTVTLVRTNVASVTGGCVGRRSEGLVSAPERCAAPIADFFTSVAHLEAASVDAFRHLAAELEALGAPEALRRQALAAAADEIRHADVMGRVATRFGGRPTPPEVRALPLRDLETLALENMVEGCVRETFGALLATYQARTARDADIALEMGRIAEDETRHAALAWRIADWAEALLSEAGRGRVREARRQAVSALRVELSSEVPRDLRTVAGVPDARAALELLDGLDRAAWS
jgi:hypothetical protein